MKIKLPIARVDIGSSRYVEFKWYSYELERHNERGQEEPRVHVNIWTDVPYQQWLEAGRPMEWTVEIERPPS